MVIKLPGKAVIYLLGVTRIHLDDGQVDCKILIIIKEGLLQKVESSAKNVATLSIYVGPILYSNNLIVSGVLFLFYKLDDEHNSRELFCWHIDIELGGQDVDSSIEQSVTPADRWQLVQKYVTAA